MFGGECSNVLYLAREVTLIFSICIKRCEGWKSVGPFFRIALSLHGSHRLMCNRTRSKCSTYLGCSLVVLSPSMCPHVRLFSKTCVLARIPPPSCTLRSPSRRTSWGVSLTARRSLVPRTVTLATEQSRAR